MIYKRKLFKSFSYFYFLVFKFYPGKFWSFLVWFLRIFGVVCFLVSYFMFIKYFDDIPNYVDDASLTSGYVDYVKSDGGNRGGASYFTLKDGRKFHSYRHTNIKKIKPYKGEIIKIWSYSVTEAFLFEKNIVIEVEVEGEKIFKDWGYIKQGLFKVEYLHYPVVFCIMGFLIFAFLYFYLDKEYRSREGSVL